MAKTVRIGSRVSPRVNEWLDKKSEEMGISKSAIIAIACENYMKEQEVVYGLPKLVEQLEKYGIDLK